MTAAIIESRLQERQSLNIALLAEMFFLRDGLLIRRTTINYRAKSGVAAGTVDKSTGYIKVNFDGRVRLIHRLVWALAHSQQPPQPLTTSTVFGPTTGSRTSELVRRLRT